jgi:hypothetical protein
MGLKILWNNPSFAKQRYGVRLAVDALELVEHFSDGHACIPPCESGHVRHLELVGCVLIQHAEARLLDVFVRLSFVLCTCEHGIRRLDLCRELKLRDTASVPR